MEKTDAPSRFAICRVGEGYSVEDRKTGERLSYHRSHRLAVIAQLELSRTMKAKLRAPCNRYDIDATAVCPYCGIDHKGASPPPL